MGNKMKIQLVQFGEILTSRPAGKETGLALCAYLKPKQKEVIELDFSNVLSIGPSWLDEVLSKLYKTFGKKRVRILPTQNASVAASLKAIGR
jgi:hypothetical protein